MDENAKRRLEAMQAKYRQELACNPLYRQPGWVGAYARLLTLLPGVAKLINAPWGMAPDPILEAATNRGERIESVLLYNPWRGDPNGRGTKPWESYTTLELFDVVFAEHPLTSGSLWFIPDECFGTREPYLLSSENLREFIENNDHDLHQDALFIWQTAPRLSLTHHSGGFFHIMFAVQTP